MHFPPKYLSTSDYEFNIWGTLEGGEKTGTPKIFVAEGPFSWLEVLVANLQKGKEFLKYKEWRGRETTTTSDRNLEDKPRLLGGPNRTPHSGHGISTTEICQPGSDFLLGS